MVLGERSGAGLGVSKVIETPSPPVSLKSKRSLPPPLLTCESLSSQEASEGDRGGAEATAGDWQWLDWDAGLKTEVSASCSRLPWTNTPLSTAPSPPVGRAESALPLSISRLKESLASDCGGELLALVAAVGMVKGGAVALSSLLKASGLMGETVKLNRSWDKGAGTRTSSGKVSAFQGLGLVSPSGK